METIISAVLSALVTGTLALVGVFISNRTAQAVTNTKLEELTREVREHNGFARRMPVVEAEIKALRHDVSDLQDYHKQPKHKEKGE